ncbi:hypothetical protein J7E71_07940 [Mesobacillus foraminis]|uniref:hypothetical protein n=1 Tax=Mesobacillus foraminis TaxID=279826 RepID=UPI001BE75D8C|nr:hypothetical protein [Mesobacillus foraminis]MBT2755877.1 hypothetical protein [Mesobacillus foraminis]
MDTEYRKEFLLKMYDQLNNEINRHISSVWQSAGVLVGAFALFSLTEKNIIPIDLAIAIIVCLLAWYVLQVIDSNYWYNRNLAIITNIERQFLLESDLKNIHYYFGLPRNSHSILTNFKIQLFLGRSLVLFLLLYHLIIRIFPGFNESWTNFEPLRLLPYVAIIISAIFIRWLKNKRIKDYEEFLKNSPGITVNVQGIKYGGGHGFESADKSIFIKIFNTIDKLLDKIF